MAVASTSGASSTVGTQTTDARTPSNPVPLRQAGHGSDGGVRARAAGPGHDGPDTNQGIHPGPASSYQYAKPRPTSGWAQRFFRHASAEGYGRYQSANQEYTRKRGDQLPDGVPVVPAEMTLRQSRDGSAMLRFDMTTANLGKGPLEIVLGESPAGQDPRTARRPGMQLVYNTDAPRGQQHRREVTINGKFEFHPAHEHIHFEDFAKYELFRKGGKGLGDGKKVSFLITDTDDINGTVKGPDGKRALDPRGKRKAISSWKGQEVQGLSVGHGDTYTKDLPGQGMKIPKSELRTIRRGGHRDYVLRQSFDPSNRIVERNDGNNVIDTVLRVSKDANGKISMQRIETHRAPVTKCVKDSGR